MDTRTGYPTVEYILPCAIDVSRDSAGRLGFVGGLTLFACAAVSGWIWGFDTLSSWQFLVGFMAFGFVLGLVIRPIVAALVLR